MDERKLLNYLPPVLQEIAEFEAITVGEQPEIRSLWELSGNILSDQFVDTATIGGLERWERLLKIKPQPSATMEERRFAIRTWLVESTPFTFRGLEQILTGLFGEGGFAIEMDTGEYLLTIVLDEITPTTASDVSGMLRRVIPANMDAVLGVFTAWIGAIHVRGGLVQTTTHNISGSVSF